MKNILLTILITTFPYSVWAQTQNLDEATIAQSDMLKRIATASYAYANEVGLDASYVSYCQTKLSYETESYPKNGSIPYGADYRTITGNKLATVISVREAYETVYLKLCLADARATLNNAKIKP